ncbi:WD40-repeat-containing domain protein [Lipomyces arxii]|uniref:WD40-repeat-containing domain protein n=1 Tax=Lipomyces arxii TaxID=56418 RepID=UPI0034CEC1A1
MAEIDGGINDYEAQRRANIERNNALLRDLELANLGAALGPTAISSSSGSKRRATGSPGVKPTVKRTTKTQRPKQAVEVLPRRTSARLAGIEPESEKARVKAETEYVALQEAEKEARKRVGGDIKFEDLSSDKIAQLWTFDDDEPDSTETKTSEIAGDIVQLRKEMSGLKLYEKFEPNDIKITPERVYTIGFHPSASKRLVFAGDKIGNLGVWDIDQVKSEDDEEFPQTYLFKVHARTLANFAFAPSITSKIYTASYDGSIRCVDFVSGISSEVYYGTLGREPDAVSELQFADANTLYFSTLDGEVGRLDLRTPKDITKYRLHDKKIGGLSLHPNAPYLAATASLDRSMKLWDFRKIESLESGELQPKFLSSYDSRLSISCTSWNNEGSIVCNGYDDTINIFNLKDSTNWDVNFNAPEELTPSSKIKHNCQTGRWVTILRSHWQRNPLDNVQKFVIGNMNRFMDVYTADGIQLARLGDSDLIRAVPAACQFHATKNWIVGGTASGKVCLFE